MRFKGSVSYRFGDGTNIYFTRSEGYRIGGGNNFRVCTDEEIALLTDDDPSNDPPQSGCIYADQALIEPDTTTNYEIGLRRSWGAWMAIPMCSLRFGRMILSLVHPFGPPRSIRIILKS